MKEIILKTSQGAKYLSDFMTTFPDGILNKVDTGCGATTVALTNPEHTIVCCPSKSLINNKIVQYPNEKLECPYFVLGVMQGVFKDDIIQFVDECGQRNHPVKIMVTYDSFYKVKQAIPEIEDYRIIIDEYQELLKIYSYRDKAVRRLLKDIRGLEKVTFISATPIPYGYVPEELKRFRNYKIDWGSTIRCKPIRKKTNEPYLVAKNMILRHKQGEGGGKFHPDELFFFVNSVKSIKNIIEGAGLTNDDVRVICADNAENRKTLDEIEVSTTASPNKPYTFCTSTVFYGSDFYSKSGLVVIISDRRNQNTRLDISTDIIQIAGRIRNKENPYKNVIFHIYNTGGKNQTREELDAYLEERTSSAEVLIYLFEKADEKKKRAIAERVKMRDEDEFALYDEESNTLELNQMKINYLIYKFESVDEVYKNGAAIREAYAQEGMDVSEAQQWEYIAEEYFTEITNSNRFKNLYLEYLDELKMTVFGQRTIRARRIESLYPTIYDITQYLTPEEVRKRYYNITLVNDLLHSRLPVTQEAIKDGLRPVFKEGDFYPSVAVKKMFKTLYDSISLKIAPKASDIQKYYEIRESKQTVNGKRVNGYQINGKLFFVYSHRRMYPGYAG